MFLTLSMHVLYSMSRHLPEAGFRRHAPRQWKRRWRWRWGDGAVWLLRTAVSSLGTYISLIGQSSTSALLSPSTRPSRTVTASGTTREGMQPPVKPNADFSLSRRHTALDFDDFLQLFFQGPFSPAAQWPATATGTSE